MLTLQQYWNGYDKRYPNELTTRINAEAAETVRVLNQLAVALQKAGIRLEVSPKTGSILTSGWRPEQVNSTTPGAAVRSLHILALAADLYDPEGELDEFLLSDKGQAILVSLDLWLEHPSATKGWCHVQRKPPRSGRRVFYP